MQTVYTCRVCGETKPLDQFGASSTSKNGRTTDCKVCRAAYARTYWDAKGRPSHHTPAQAAGQAAKRADRKRRVRKIKLWFGCADCGYREHGAALQFDHRPGEQKLFTIGHEMGTRSWASILAEIAKCDIVCANCHAVRTESRVV